MSRITDLEHDEHRKIGGHLADDEWQHTHEVWRGYKSDLDEGEPKYLINRIPGTVPVTVAAGSIYGHNLLRAFVNYLGGERKQPIYAFIGGRTVEFDSLQAKFDTLVEQWETFHLGRSVLKFDHSAYMQVVGMGSPVIPLILNRLEAGDPNWIYALKLITGEQVEGPEIVGDAEAVIGAWLEWGRKHGHIKADGQAQGYQVLY